MKITIIGLTFCLMITIIMRGGGSFWWMPHSFLISSFRSSLDFHLISVLVSLHFSRAISSHSSSRSSCYTFFPLILLPFHFLSLMMISLSFLHIPFSFLPVQLILLYIKTNITLNCVKLNSRTAIFSLYSSCAFRCVEKRHREIKDE